jgi:hypothetical protein
VRSWIGAAAAAVFLAGCGTAVAAPAAGPARAVAAGPASAVAAGPARAEALARHLVAEMHFPRGTKPAPLRSAPPGLISMQPGSDWAGAERLLLAPVKPAAVWAALLPHPPFDSGGTMGVAGSSGPVGSDALLPAPEPGIAAAEANVWVEPWSRGTTLIAAYAYATWLPVRSAAEHLNPGSFRAVTISADTIVPQQHEITRTFTSATVIGRLAAFLNGRPAAPQLSVPCPFPATSYQLRFTAKAHRGPVVTVSPSCMTDLITVNGAAQPSVWDTGAGLVSIIRGLPGL